MICRKLSPFAHRFYGDIGIDLPTLLKQSSATIPIMLLYSREAEMALKMFTDFANRKQTKTLQVSITDNNQNTERTARKHLQKAISEVGQHDSLAVKSLLFIGHFFCVFRG